MRRYLLLCLFAALSVQLSVAHEENIAPEDKDMTELLAGLSTDGQTTSTACTVSSGPCAQDGSTNYISRSLTYNTTTGIFSGTIITNLCSNDRYGRFNGTLNTNVRHTAQCVQQTFPAKTYATPDIAPLRGITGYSITGGVSIYGPFDAGFVKGQACSNNLGTCEAGTDVVLCDSKLRYECGTGFNAYMLLDDCGGHAQPYHYHTDLACDYNTTVGGHSELVGLALDGRGLYGKYESTNTKPTDLDACGGHYGNVPSYTIGGVTYPAATNVYHYHTQDEAPFTMACYGPVTSLSACKSLYSTCNTGYGTYYTELGCYKDYDLDCPCFKQGNETSNQVTAGLTASQCSTGFASAPAVWSVLSVLLMGLFAQYSL